MAFDFSSLASTKPVSNIDYLKPYSINENVEIVDTEIKEGVSDKGNSWKCLYITFGNDEGIYRDSIFYIMSEKDFERTTAQMSNGGTRQMPSNWERTRDHMAAIGYAFFPENFEKLKDKSSKFKSFEELITVFKKMCDQAKGKVKTGMKLVGRKSGDRMYASLPNCTGMAQATEKTAASNGVNVGDWYTWMISPFGNSLFFSAFEESQRESYVNAKPTEMKSEVEDTMSVDKSDDEFDLESLL